MEERRKLREQVSRLKREQAQLSQAYSRRDKQLKDASLCQMNNYFRTLHIKLLRQW